MIPQDEYKDDNFFFFFIGRRMTINTSWKSSKINFSLGENINVY